MKLWFKFLLNTLLLGIFFYVPNDISLYLPVCLCLILSFFYKFNIRKERVNLGNPFFALIPIVFYALIICLFQTTTDLFFIKTLIKIIIIATGINAMVGTFRLTLYQNLLSVYMVLFLNIIISLLQYFNLFGLSHWALSLNAIFIKPEIYFREFRAMGLMGGYDSNGMLMAFSFLIIYILIINEKNPWRRRCYLGCSLLNILGIFIASRVGVIAAVLGVFLLSIQVKKKLSEKYSPYWKLLILTIILLSSLFVLGPKKTLLSSVNFIFEPFINYCKYGEIRTQSTDGLLKDHYKLPNGWKTLVWGNGYDNANPIYGANTDVGYLQIIFGLGIIGLCLVIFVYLYWIKIILENINLSRPGLYQDINYFSLSYIIIIFINSLKGPYFLAYTLIYLFAYTLMLSSKFKSKY